MCLEANRICTPKNSTLEVLQTANSKQFVPPKTMMTEFPELEYYWTSVSQKIMIPKWYEQQEPN